MKGGGRRKVDNDVFKLWHTPLLLQQTLGSTFFPRDRGPWNAGGAGGA